MVFSKSDTGKIEYSHAKISTIIYNSKQNKTPKSLDPCLTPHTKFNSKWIIAVSVKSKTINLLGENIHDLGLGKDFSGVKPKAHP